MKILGKPLTIASVLHMALLGALVMADDGVDLKEGATAPVFEVTDDTGARWRSSDHVGKRAVFFFFFPAALTGG